MYCLPLLQEPSIYIVNQSAWVLGYSKNDNLKYIHNKETVTGYKCRHSLYFAL